MSTDDSGKRTQIQACVVLGVLFAVLILSGCKREISGSYLASDKIAVCWLQLVRTPDNHLSGQIVLSTLTSDGQIEHQSVSVTGAVNGENVTLTGSGFLGLASATLSGTVDAKRLTLTGVQSTPIILKRATLAEYQGQLSDQSTRSQAIISAKAAAETRQRVLQGQQNFITEVDQLIPRMEKFESDADVHLSRFPNAEKSYQAITAKMNEYVTRERKLAGNENAANDRSRLVNAATQASFATDQIHNQAESLESSLEVNVAPLVREVTALENGCRQVGQKTDTRGACNRLLNAASTFHQKYEAMSAGLKYLQEVYKRQKSAQDGLLASAQQIE